MKTLYFILLFPILLISCQGNKTNTNTDLETIRNRGPQIAETVTILPDTLATNPANKKQKLALASNALQLVDIVTGSTREITFGMAFDQLVTIVGRILERKPTSVGINTECSADPLKMATWPDGLTLFFREKERGKEEWLFAGLACRHAYWQWRQTQNYVWNWRRIHF